MPKAAKTINFGCTALPGAANGDVLHFLTRTLQAHILDAAPQDVLAKLQNLKSALNQQETTLSDWPDSPSKERICAALAKANRLVAQLVDKFGAAAADETAARNAKTV